MALAASSAPRIELDLAGVETIERLSTPIFRSHDLAASQPDGTAVVSRQDWSERCPAGKGTTLAQCPFPVAKAFDHHDKVIKVKTRVFLVDVDGNTCGTGDDHDKCKALCGDVKSCEVTKVSFAERSTYLFKYDASDNAGNHAEQVVFALILDDTSKPTIKVCDGSAEKVEAASKTWHLCTSATASDNIDGPLTKNIRYTIRDQDATGSAPLCKNAPYEDYVAYMKNPSGPVPCAKHALSTNNVGRYVIEFKVCDKAGVYGENSARNCVSRHKAVWIKDTLKPWIDVHGAEPTLHECGAAYTDVGATVHDLLDTEALSRDLNKAPYYAVDSNVESTRVGDYTVKYAATDVAGNTAKPQERLVQIRDTTKPVMHMDGEHEVIVQTCDPKQNSNCPADPSKPTDWAVTCTDSCGGNSDKDLVDLSTTVVKSWDRQFDGVTKGSYVRTYTCTDAEGNAASMERKFTVVDDDVPVIKLMGDDAEEWNASLTTEYTDKGATCTDHVDGVLSNAVEVSGNVVNMRIPGTYTIKYDCQDLSGNKAQQMVRTVKITDDSCPTVTIKGSNVVHIEAGFDYIDEGAAAVDDLDGDISQKIWTEGDNVNSKSVFYGRRSCAEIKASADKTPSSGQYWISVKANGSFARKKVTCDFSKGAKETYAPCDNCERVIPYGTNDGGCAAMGMVMAQSPSAYAKKKFAAYISADATATMDSYLCSTSAAADQDDAFNAHSLKISHAKINRAEAGKYKITYHVEDSSGNAECKESLNKRTVIVRDSLPPVITLHLRNKLIHVGDGSGSGQYSSGEFPQGPVADGASETSANKVGRNNEVNPAYSNANPSIKAAPTDAGSLRQETENRFPRNDLMAEASASSASGWVIAAAASAVTGLALLAVTARKAPLAAVEV
jgi:hypothetical protein